MFDQVDFSVAIDIKELHHKEAGAIVIFFVNDEDVGIVLPLRIHLLNGFVGLQIFQVFVQLNGVNQRLPFDDFFSFARFEVR